MARPRKNPDDPKWNVGTSQQANWNACYLAALMGLIGKGGLSTEQVIKSAKQWADAAHTEMT